MQLYDYLPPILQPIKDYQVLAVTEQPEIDALKAAVAQGLSDQFVADCSDAGLSRTEQSLQLTADPKAPLATRRFRILSLLNNQLPYSRRWLQDKLATVFGGMEQFQMSVVAYELNIEVDSSHADQLNDLYTDLRTSIPANMVLHTATATSISFMQYLGIVIQYADDCFL